jgi:hypothetical protein
MSSLPKRVIPNEVRNLAAGADVTLDAQRDQPPSERSLALLGMTLHAAGPKQPVTRSSREIGIPLFNLSILAVKSQRA